MFTYGNSAKLSNSPKLSASKNIYNNSKNKFTTNIRHLSAYKAAMA